MSFRKKRGIVQRWIIEAKLQLVTPTSLGNGEDDPLVELPIVLDALEGRALLTGASLAGALRSYLAEFDPALAIALFGGERGDATGYQSPLIVRDALGDRPNIELRDGVSIDPATRTAKENELYDRQLLAAGAIFAIGFELVISTRDEETEKNGSTALERIKAALAQALYGLQEKHIRLGGRKRRGYGECRVIEWQMWTYRLTVKEELQHWLEHGRRGEWRARAWGGPGVNILDWPALQGVSRPADNRDRVELEAQMAIDGSLLIRSGFESQYGPDMAHLETQSNDSTVPVLSGTSLAGVLRSQALRIARTIAGENQSAAEKLVKQMFGYMPPREELERGEKRRASRLVVSESRDRRLVSPVGTKPHKD